ncbi:hypothetical protein TeGR_g1245 [Tetraparma gracilis]|uniref:Uncharacterized protein n=1 Tax=Tetraparma gracilis TaxID=2962635 RepID=A0ABQ6N994_9STRA|nr:hypothetical protein TeGR_g1245 [Tetraparma gracilis]
MAARHDAPGSGNWQYAYHAPKTNTRTAKPAIPEPKARVGPPGVSSGVSFRNLPDASLMSIRDICSHYEKKCSGAYSSNSLAGRYVFQMSREIGAQLQAMSASSGGQGQRVRDLENVLEEWNACFGRNAEEGTQGVFGIVPMTPTALKHTLVSQRARVRELEASVAALQGSQDAEASKVKELMSSHAAAARLQAAADRARAEAALAAMRARCDADVALAAERAESAREEARKALEYDRARATRTVKEALASAKEESSALRADKEALEARLAREWASKLRHLELKARNAEAATAQAVERAVERARRAGAQELQRAVKEAAARAGQAAVAQGKAGGGGLSRGSTSAASKARVEARDARRAGGGAELLRDEDGAGLAPLTADELANGADGPGVVVMREGGGERREAPPPPPPAGGARAGPAEAGEAPPRAAARREPDRSSEISLLALKLKNSTEEASYLKSRVADLETMVKTMRVAIEGSLEEGAGERNFGGWRQVYAVQYPWLRDRKREDPKRYSYLKQHGGKGIRVPTESF